LLSLAKFVGWGLGAVAAEAWSTPAVLACAERWATGRRRLAEIGVWQGAVTCRIRAVMAADGLLFAIDPYPAGRLGINYQQIIAGSEVAKIKRGEVVWLRETGEQASRNLRVKAAAPFDFVFVDADHTIAGLTDNWQAWTPMMEPGGPSAHGTPRFCDTIARQDPRFEFVDAVDQLLVLRRR
jgi:methyltransferase family protein